MLFYPVWFAFPEKQPDQYFLNRHRLITLTASLFSVLFRHLILSAYLALLTFDLMDFSTFRLLTFDFIDFRLKTSRAASAASLSLSFPQYS